MNIQEIRQRFPQYDNMSDGDLASALHQKFYPSMDFGEFGDRIGLTSGFDSEAMARAREAVAGTRDVNVGRGARAASAAGEFFGENKVGRGITAILQGAAKGNPLVGAASFLTPLAERENLTQIEPETVTERALGTAAEFMAPAGVMAKAGRLGASAIKGTGKLARGARAVLTPLSTPAEYAAAAGAGALTGAVNPESTLGQIGTGIVGGMSGAGIAGLINRGALGGVGMNFMGRAALKDSLADARALQQADGSLKSKISNWGRSVDDVDFGQLTKGQKAELNSIRADMGLAPITDPNVTVPADAIRHMTKRLDEGQSARDVSNMLDRAIYSPDSAISRQLPNSAHPGRQDIQAFVNLGGNPYDVGFVAGQSGQPEVRSAFNMRPREAAKKFPDIQVGDNFSGGTTSSLNDAQKGIGSQGGFTARPINNIIDQNSPEVKRAYRLLEKQYGRAGLQNMIDEANTRGVALLDLDETSLGDLARIARDRSSKAADKLTRRYKDLRAAAPDENTRILNESMDRHMFPEQAAAELSETYAPTANAFRERSYARNLRTDDEFKNIIRNKHVSDALDTITRTSAEIAHLPNNNIQKLHRAQQILDAKIQAIDEGKNSAEKAMRVEFVKARDKLSDMLTSRDTNFREAQKYDRIRIRGENAIDEGARFAQGYYNSARDVTAKMSDYGQIERHSARTGFLNQIQNIMEGKVNGQNLTSLTSPKMKEKIRAVLNEPGNDYGDRLNQHIQNQVNQMRVGNRIGSGSMTSTNMQQAEAAMDMIESAASLSPTKAARGIAKYIDRKLDAQTLNSLSDILIADPNQLQIPANKAGILARILQDLPVSGPSAANVYMQSVLGE